MQVILENPQVFERFSNWQGITDMRRSSSESDPHVANYTRISPVVFSLYTQ